MTSAANARTGAKPQSTNKTPEIRRRRNPKSQNPNPKEPPKSKLQKQKLQGPVTRYLGFGICLDPGIWKIGVCTPSKAMLLRPRSGQATLPALDSATQN